VSESPLFVKTYDFLLYLFPLTAKFPRSLRASLTSRLEIGALAFHETLVRAALRKGQTATHLEEADVTLSLLRLQLRLARDLRVLPTGSYAHASKLLDEIGRLLGTWKKQSVRGQAQ